MMQESSCMMRRGESLRDGGTRILLSLLFVGVFAVGSASAQATYSTEWGDDSDSSDIKAVAAGVTESSYYSYGLVYFVETDLTSPTGQMATFRSPTGTTFARSEGWFWWGGVFGFWNVVSRHWTWNYYQNYGYISGYTSSSNNWYAVGSDYLEYWNDQKRPITANPRMCSYILCYNFEWHTCAANRRGIDRNDGGEGTEDCRPGFYRAFNVTHFIVDICTETTSYSHTYDPCPGEHVLY